MALTQNAILPLAAAAVVTAWGLPQACLKLAPGTRVGAGEGLWHAQGDRGRSQAWTDLPHRGGPGHQRRLCHGDGRASAGVPALPFPVKFRSAGCRTQSVCVLFWQSVLAAFLPCKGPGLSAAVLTKAIKYCLPLRTVEGLIHV